MVDLAEILHNIEDQKFGKLAQKVEKFERTTKSLLQDVIFHKNGNPKNFKKRSTLKPQIDAIKAYLKDMSYPLDKDLSRILDLADELRNGAFHANTRDIAKALDRHGYKYQTSKIVQGFIGDHPPDSVRNILDNMLKHWKNSSDSFEDVKMTGIHDTDATEYIKNLDAATPNGILDTSIQCMTNAISLIGNIRKFITDYNI